MPSILLSGPPLAGKSQAAIDALAERQGRGVIVDFQQLYATLLGIRRLPNGRYPLRLEADSYILPLVERVRQTTIRQAVDNDLEVIATNSDSRPDRRRYLLSLLGPGASEIVLDPGAAEIRRRLQALVSDSLDGAQVESQCEEAFGRWYKGEKINTLTTVVRF